MSIFAGLAAAFNGMAETQKYAWMKNMEEEAELRRATWRERAAIRAEQRAEQAAIRAEERGDISFKNRLDVQNTAAIQQAQQMRDKGWEWPTVQDKLDAETEAKKKLIQYKEQVTAKTTTGGYKTLGKDFLSKFVTTVNKLTDQQSILQNISSNLYNEVVPRPTRGAGPGAVEKWTKAVAFEGYYTAWAGLGDRERLALLAESRVPEWFAKGVLSRGLVGADVVKAAYGGGDEAQPDAPTAASEKASAGDPGASRSVAAQANEARSGDMDGIFARGGDGTKDNPYLLGGTGKKAESVEEFLQQNYGKWILMMTPNGRKKFWIGRGGQFVPETGR